MDVLYLTEAIDDEDASVRALPDLFGNNVVVFRLRTRRLDVTPYTHTNSFSIKTVFSGIERYHFEEREVGVAPGDILMVSPGRTYGSSIRSSEVTDSFSIFLPQQWVEEHMNHCRLDRVRRFLNAGAAPVCLPLATNIGSSMRDLAGVLSQSEGGGLAAEEALVGVTERVFGLVESAGELAARIDATSPSTRVELLRRVSRVRDLLDARIQAGVSLAELSREACLSEFHLLRVFKQAFGTTPARYLERRRMERARELLFRSDLAIADVAASCGYSNLSAFGRAFRRAWGTSASGLRESSSEPAL